MPRSRESLQSMPGGSYGLSDNYGAAGRSQRQYVGSSSSSTLTLPSRARTPGPSMPSSNGSGRGIRSNASDSGGSSSAAMLNPRGSLYRKALSLEQTMSMPDEQVHKIMYCKLLIALKKNNNQVIECTENMERKFRRW